MPSNQNCSALFWSNFDKKDDLESLLTAFKGAFKADENEWKQPKKKEAKQNVNEIPVIAEGLIMNGFGVTSALMLHCWLACSLCIQIVLINFGLSRFVLYVPVCRGPTLLTSIQGVGEQELWT